MGGRIQDPVLLFGEFLMGLALTLIKSGQKPLMQACVDWVGAHDPKINARRGRVHSESMPKIHAIGEAKPWRGASDCAKGGMDPTSKPSPSSDIHVLLTIMAALRTPGTGCPWDLEQNFASIAPYTVEEAYEVADAIERQDFVDLRDELGDLLLQVVFHARMAEEDGLFDFGGVVEAITAKLIRRHPHVFGDARDLSPDEVKVLWGRIKQAEKAERAAARRAQGLPETEGAGHLGAVPVALPALTRAIKLQNKAADVGFDWPDIGPVFDKIKEETDELKQAYSDMDSAAIEEEYGDLLFVMANLARHLKIDPEAALKKANSKFQRRFAHIEARLAEQGIPLAEAGLERMDALWNEARVADKKRT